MKARTAKRNKDTKKKDNEELITELNENYMRFLQSGSESMKYFINTGDIANKLKKSIKHSDFRRTIETDLDHIDIRQLQRAMRLVKHYEFTRYEVLYHVPRSHLERIIRKAGKTGVASYLKENDVNLDIDIENEDNFKTILCDIKKLSEITKKKSNTTKLDKSTRDNDINNDERANFKKNNNYSFSYYLEKLKKYHITKINKGEKINEKTSFILKNTIKEISEILSNLSDY